MICADASFGQRFCKGVFENRKCDRRREKRCPDALTVFGYTQRKGGHGMDVQLKDILVMKKAHPCGECRWEVLRTGMDFRLRCLGCGREVLLPRSKAEKGIRQILRDGQSVPTK